MKLLEKIIYEKPDEKELVMCYKIKVRLGSGKEETLEDCASLIPKDDNDGKRYLTELIEDMIKQTLLSR